MKEKLLILLVLLLPMLVIIPFLNQIPYFSTSTFSDLPITHLPNGLFIKRSLMQYKMIPLWSDTILSGYPFSSEPHAGLWYFPGLLALLFPVPLGFNLIAVIHLIWGGVGMYFFSRSEGNGVAPSLAGAVIFGAMPKLMAQFAGGHLRLLYAMTWTPWLIWAQKRYHKSRSFKNLLDVAIIFGMTILADARWLSYAGPLWLLHEVYLAVNIYSGTAKTSIKYRFSLLQKLLHWAPSFISQFVIGILDFI